VMRQPGCLILTQHQQSRQPAHPADLVWRLDWQALPRLGSHAVVNYGFGLGDALAASLSSRKRPAGLVVGPSRRTLLPRGRHAKAQDGPVRNTAHSTGG